MQPRLIASLLAALTLCAPLAASAAAPPDDEHQRFLATPGKYADLTWEGLVAHWGLAPEPAPAPLSFDPAEAKHYDAVVEKLRLPEAGKQALAREGFVVATRPWGGVTVADALRDIYTSDLPLLVTTDAIADAAHRSYDDVMADLEEGALAPLLGDALEIAHARLLRIAKRHPELAEAAADAELYLVVARNLVAPDDQDKDRYPEFGGEVPTALSVPPTLAERAEVAALLSAVDSGALENGDGQGTVIYGKKRRIDWTQFTVRGHYTDSPTLVRYFRTMAWLGRADLGFQLDDRRQLRAAALLAHVVRVSGAGRRLAEITKLVDLFVGGADDADLDGLLALMKGEGAGDLDALSDPQALERVAEALAASGFGQPRIRSQIVKSELADPAHAMAGASVQLLGQRFTIDSFVLSHVVYDDIVFEGQKQLRRLPTSLDVMAALGSDTAARLLQPEVEAWRYGANLAALREIVGARGDDRWGESLYDLWLAALRTLSTPPTEGFVPEVMRRPAWARKTLQTQLASWAHLRHDTILYAQQSYSAGGGCIYPKAYVEPVPDFYAAFARYARTAAARIGALRTGDRAVKKRIKPLVRYFKGFAKIMDRLERLANKELRGQPFTKSERMFLRHTVEGVDSGEEEYDPIIDWSGWYMDLVYNDGPRDARALQFQPTIADVHTDAHTGQVLEVGTGSVDFAVVAIDNDGDRAIYVGPTLSFYEVTQPASDRMDDDGWAQALWADTPPAPPAWLALPRVRLPAGPIE